MHANHNLLLIVHVNEKIKRVVRRAHAINLLALNAILLARRAGTTAAGFGVIADELRTFSKTLSDSMRMLMALSFESVGVISRQCRDRRIATLIGASTQLLREADLATPAFAHAISNTAAARADTLRETIRSLERLLDEAEDATRFGSVIARSLKIEAAYGREFSAALEQIAAEFSESIVTIPPILQQLQRQIHTELLHTEPLHTEPRMATA